MGDIDINGQLYSIPPAEALLSTEYLHKVFIAAGKPTKLEGESAWRMVDAIMGVWFALYPWEVDEWTKRLKEDQSAERSIADANKANGGYFPISYPTRLLMMIKIYFRNERFADHDLIKKFVKRYPILKRTRFNI